MFRQLPSVMSLAPMTPETSKDIVNFEPRIRVDGDRSLLCGFTSSINLYFVASRPALFVHSIWYCPVLLCEYGCHSDRFGPFKEGGQTCFQFLVFENTNTKVEILGPRGYADMNVLSISDAPTADVQRTDKPDVQMMVGHTHEDMDYSPPPYDPADIVSTCTLKEGQTWSTTMKLVRAALHLEWFRRLSVVVSPWLQAFITPHNDRVGPMPMLSARSFIINDTDAKGMHLFDEHHDVDMEQKECNRKWSGTSRQTVSAMQSELVAWPSLAFYGV
jgi:hypothetical protein